MSIKIVLVDDHEMFRDGIKSLMHKEPGFAVIGEARDGLEGIRVADQLKPDIVLLDLYMPHLNGIEATIQIRSNGSKCKVVGLSSCNDQRTINCMLTAGASAYISKRWPFSELCQAIGLVHSNQPYRVPTALRAPLGVDKLRRSSAGKLSIRERETLTLIAAGKSSKDIAEALCVCTKTVEAHRHSLRKKLGCSSVAELTRYAIHEGFVNSEG